MVICNSPFGVGFLGSALDGASEVHWARRAFAETFGAWAARRGGCRGQKLDVDAVHVGFAWPGIAPGAIHDCAATLAQVPAPGRRRL